MIEYDAESWANLRLVRHSLVADALGRMRSRDCTPQEFRAGARTIARSLAYEATADLPLVSITVDTPMEQTVGQGLMSSFSTPW